MQTAVLQGKRSKKWVKLVFSNSSNNKNTDTDFDGSATGKETKEVSHTDTDLDCSAAGKETKEVGQTGIQS